MEQMRNGLSDLVSQYESAMSRNMDPEDMKDAMALRPERFEKGFLGRGKRR